MIFVVIHAYACVSIVCALLLEMWNTKLETRSWKLGTSWKLEAGSASGVKLKLKLQTRKLHYWAMVLVAANDHASQATLQKWLTELHGWDNALDPSVKGACPTLTLLRILCAVFSDWQCPMNSCDHDYSWLWSYAPLCYRLLSHHVFLESEAITPADLTTLIISIASDSDSFASDSDSDPFSVILSPQFQTSKSSAFLSYLSDACHDYSKPIAWFWSRGILYFQ